MPKGKNPNAVELGRRGGKARAAAMTPEERAELMRELGRKGGKRSLVTMTPEQRRLRAQKAAAARKRQKQEILEQE
jgi:general stress protein YciG